MTLAESEARYEKKLKSLPRRGMKNSKVTSRYATAGSA